MEKDDIKSQLEKAKLVPFGSPSASQTADSGLAQGPGTESALRKSVPLTPTEASVEKAEAEIRKGVGQSLAPMMEARQAERIGQAEAQLAEGREGERVQTARAVSEMSTRALQEQVAKRVNPQGQAVQRPRLAQKRPQKSTAQAVTEGVAKSALKIVGLPLGASVLGGLLAYWLT